MARDATLLDRAEDGVIGSRVYGWDGPWVTLGRFQTPERALLPDCPIPYAKRPTGGRAVLHGHDVTVGLAVPLEVLGVDSSRRLRAVYESVCGVLVEALCGAGMEGCGLQGNPGFQPVVRTTVNATGLAAEPGDRGSEFDGDSNALHRLEAGVTLRSEDCFMATSPNDIVDLGTGQKICGCALRLTDRAVLVQASIPAGPPLIDPALVYAHPAPVHWIDLQPEAFAVALNRVIQANWTMPTGFPSGSEN